LLKNNINPTTHNTIIIVVKMIIFFIRSPSFDAMLTLHEIIVKSRMI